MDYIIFEPRRYKTENEIARKNTIIARSLRLIVYGDTREKQVIQQRVKTVKQMKKNFKKRYSGECGKVNYRDYRARVSIASRRLPLFTLFVCRFFLKKRSICLRRTLNNNNLTTLPSGMFSDLYRLRNIRLSDNRFWCDCKLEWLYQQWLPRIPRLGSSTHCHGPANMAGLPLADMHKHHMQCGERTRAMTLPSRRGPESPGVSRGVPRAPKTWTQLSSTKKPKFSFEIQKRWQSLGGSRRIAFYR